MQFLKGLARGEKAFSEGRVLSQTDAEKKNVEIFQIIKDVGKKLTEPNCPRYWTT